MVGGATGELGIESTTGGSADPSMLLDIIGIPADDGPADAEVFASVPIVVTPHDHLCQLIPTLMQALRLH